MSDVSVASGIPGRKGRKTKLNKRSLMLSAATVALLASTVASHGSSTDVSVDEDEICVSGADIHCIDDKVTSAVATSTATGVDSAAGPSNVYIFYDSDNGYGKVVFKKENTALVTLDSDNYVYSNGILSNVESSGAQGIRVDLSSDRTEYDSSGNPLWKFINYEEDYISGAAIYLDASSTIYLTGKGASKVAIWLDASGASDGTGTLTGDIISYYGSVISIKGDDSIGLLMDKGVTLDGNIQLSGTMYIYQHTAKSMTESNLFGIYMNGYVDGSIGIYDGGTILVAGSGARGIFVSGSGVSGNITIEGALVSEGIDSSSLSSSYYSSNSDKIYPDAGPALTVNSSVARGIAISGLQYDDDSTSTTGSVSTTGTEAAVLISPVVVANGTTYTASSSVVIGLYQSYDTDYSYADNYTYEQYDPGFGLYNRGSITISPTNVNYSVGAALKISGTSALPTYINGGIFNSGTISASASTDEKYYTVTATAVSLDGTVYVGGYYDTATGSYYYDDISVSCDGTTGRCTTTYTPDSDGIIAGLVTRSDDDSAAFVNSNTTSSSAGITATVSGKGGGTATAILISADSYLSSIYNSSNISASAATSKTGITSTLAAYGIRDLSGSLTYIYNSGTISAAATSLDSNEQIADAINLTAGTASSESADGVTIINAATSDSKAVISGDIRFGTGNNQQIYLWGASSTYLSMISGNIFYGACKDGSSSYCGDSLSIGAFGEVIGKVISTDASTYTSYIDVTVYNNGLLYLQNGADTSTSSAAEETALYANTLTVYDGGYLSVGITENSGLNDKGYIQAIGDINIYSGASLGVAYNSYVGSETGSSYVLMRTTGTLNIEDFSIYAHDISTPMSSTCTVGGDNCGTMPFLFASQTLETKSVPETNSDGSTTTYNELVVSVTTKTAEQLQLTGYGKQMFSQINAAIATDDNLGSAMVNGIHANADDLTGTAASYEAQKAYDAYAPNVSGGTRAIALSITDQATGVVAARQRSLRMFAKEEGELTLWTQEFVQSIKNPGQGAVQEDNSREKNGFKDHGFGVVVGMDAGNPTDGWYGGALTFYNGDVNEIGRTSHENQLWFVASGYGTWRGKGLFFDGKVDLGYAHIKGLRFLHLEVGTGSSQTSFVRYAQNAHSAVMMSTGFTSGATFNYGAFTFMPQLSMDGMVMRENGYTEFNPSDKTPEADGFSLTVRPHFAKSLRAFLGSSVRYDVDLLGVFLQPELRAGYRYDFLSDPTKLKAAFKDLDPDTAGNQSSSYFSLTGPDPAKGNFVLGTSIGTSTEYWSIGLSYDYIRGGSGHLEQVATFNLVGRI